MVENTVLKDGLTESMIEAGAVLLRKLDEAGVEIPLAFWHFLEDSEEWKLYFWSPMVAVEGPIEIYRFIQKSLDDMGDQSRAIPFSAISVMSSNDGLARALREADYTDHGIFQKRFRHIIGDSLVYRNWTHIPSALDELSRSIEALEEAKREAGDRELSLLADARRMEEVARSHWKNQEPKEAHRAIQYARECIRMGAIELENAKRIKAWSRAAMQKALSGDPEKTVVPQ